MIEEIIKSQNIGCIGEFIAKYADSAMAHTNPSGMHKQDIIFIIKGDRTMWATKVIQQDINESDIKWTEIARDNIKKKTSLLMKKVCYLKIKKGDLFGIYLISDDLILNEQFSDDKSYLDFITG